MASPRLWPAGLQPSCATATTWIRSRDPAGSRRRPARPRPPRAEPRRGTAVGQNGPGRAGRQSPGLRGPRRCKSPSAARRAASALPCFGSSSSSASWRPAAPVRSSSKRAGSPGEGRRTRDIAPRAELAAPGALEALVQPVERAEPDSQRHPGVRRLVLIEPSELGARLQSEPSYQAGEPWRHDRRDCKAGRVVRA